LFRSPGAHRRGVSLLLSDSLKDLQHRVNSARMLRQRHVLASREKLCPVIADSEVTQRNKHTSTPPPELTSLSPEEMQAIELENKLLEDQLLSEFEEIRGIEKNAHQVSQLLATFSENVMQQSETIGNLYDEAQQNVDIVSQVPDELHQATERSAGFRRVMLLLLLGLGCVLLALDWMS